MRHDDLYLWYLADPAVPRCVGQLRLVDAGKGVSLQYDASWLARELTARGVRVLGMAAAPDHLTALEDVCGVPHLQQTDLWVLPVGIHKAVRSYRQLFQSCQRVQA